MKGQVTFTPTLNSSTTVILLKRYSVTCDSYRSRLPDQLLTTAITAGLLLNISKWKAAPEYSGLFKIKQRIDLRGRGYKERVTLDNIALVPEMILK